NELERRTRTNYSEDVSYVARGHGDVVNDSAVIAYSAVPRLFGPALQSCSRSRACLPGISPRLRLSDGVPRASPGADGGISALAVVVSRSRFSAGLFATATTSGQKYRIRMHSCSGCRMTTRLV